jgi:hypothetical protein
MEYYCQYFYSFIILLIEFHNNIIAHIAIPIPNINVRQSRQISNTLFESEYLNILKKIIVSAIKIKLQIIQIVIFSNKDLNIIGKRPANIKIKYPTIFKYTFLSVLFSLDNFIVLLISSFYISRPTGGAPGDLDIQTLAQFVLQLTVAGIRSMAEANRAERHAWVERCAAAARNPEPHR